MSERERTSDEGRVPAGQRFYDSPFILLGLGLLVMLISFTAWGLWEIVSLTPAPLP